MSKVLIFSNMYPSIQKSYAGIFVKNQFEYLKRNDATNQYQVWALKRTFTGKIGSVKKYLLFYLKSFYKIRSGRFNIIHLHYFYPLAPIAWIFKKLYGTKIIVTVHGSDLYEKMNAGRRTAIYKRILKDFDYIVCVGEQLKTDFEKKFDIEVSEVLCAGVDKEIFYPIEGSKKIFDFIYVGSLIDRKGFDIVLETVKKTINHDVRWCIVGSGPYEEHVKELAQSYPQQVTYKAGISQQELNILYNKSRWFFFPSRNEPFGLVATESIFAGTPVICSSSGGLVEQIIENRNGFFIRDLNDMTGIAKDVLKAFRMSDSEYALLAEECRNSNYRFSLQSVCSRLINIYETI